MFKTKPNLDRKGSEPAAADDSSLNSSITTYGSSSRPPSRSQQQKKKDRAEIVVPLKDRDCRGKGETEEEMWWECQWEAMDGIGGTNRKGRQCFDKVRISWKFVTKEQEEGN